MKNLTSENLYTAALFIAVLSVVGSLYFSEYMGYIPCILCWYQRIAMYPLVPILGIGIYLKDKRLFYYALPFSITGILLSVYHNFIYYDLIKLDPTSCAFGVSCSEIYVQLLGFMDIPLMSFLAFAAITALLLLAHKTSEKQK